MPSELQQKKETFEKYKPHRAQTVDKIQCNQCLNLFHAPCRCPISLSFALLFSLFLFFFHNLGVDVKLDRNCSDRFYLCSIQSFVVLREKRCSFHQNSYSSRSKVNTRNKTLRSFCYCICANICSIPRAVRECIFSFIYAFHLGLSYAVNTECRC